VAGGEVVQRAYVPNHGPEVAVVEVGNRSGSPVHIALALRPYNPEGLAVVEAISISGNEVSVDGRAALFLPPGLQSIAISAFPDPDTAWLVAAGKVRRPEDTSAKDLAGLLQAAFVYEVEPGGVLRAAMPFHPARRRVALGRHRAGPPVDASGLTSSPTLAGEWRGVLERGTRVSVPDSRLQEAIDANRAYMLLFWDGTSITPGPYTYHRFWFRDAAYLLVAMDRWGFHEEAAEVIAAFPQRQRRDGFFYSQWKEWDSNGAALWALAEHCRLTGDDSLARRLAGSVASAARWIERTRTEGKRERPELEGLFPAGVSAEHLGPFDVYYWDDFWGLRGLLDAADLLRAAGDPVAAGEAQTAAARLRAAVFRSLELAADRLGERLIPAGPTRRIDAGMVGSLAACYPLHLLDPSNPWISATADKIRERFCIGEAFFQSIAHTGLGTYLTLQLAFVELEAGDARAWRRLRWLLDAATPTFTWPEAIHPRLGGGCMGDGHHGWAAADFLSFVRNVLVRETGEKSLALFTILPDEWIGHPVSVRDAPTHAGTISFDLEWRGAQPLLTWRCKGDGILVTAPALDEGWSSQESEGEQLFAPRDGGI
jgi:hypothetical protein